MEQHYIQCFLPPSYNYKRRRLKAFLLAIALSDDPFEALLVVENYLASEYPLKSTKVSATELKDQLERRWNQTIIIQFTCCNNIILWFKASKSKPKI